MITFSRVVLFILCLWFSLVPYAHVMTWLRPFQPTSHDRWVALPWLLLSSVAPAALIAAAVCFPLAWAFGRSAPWVAGCLAAPFPALSFHELPPNAKPLYLAFLGLSVVSYVLFVVGATMLARRFLKVCRTGGNSGSPAVV